MSADFPSKKPSGFGAFVDNLKPATTLGKCSLWLLIAVLVTSAMGTTAKYVNNSESQTETVSASGASRGTHAESPPFVWWNPSASKDESHSSIAGRDEQLRSSIADSSVIPVDRRPDLFTSISAPLLHIGGPHLEHPQNSTPAAYAVLGLGGGVSPSFTGRSDSELHFSLRGQVDPGEISNFSSVALSLSAVPEPTTTTALALSSSMLFLRRRRHSAT